MGSYILSTNSHLELAKELSKLSNIPLLESNIIYFANTEIRTSIESSIRGKDIFIITSPYNDTVNNHSINDHIMETYLLIKNCKISDASSITLICPCYPYARQDKKDNSRTCISAKDIADLFTTAGVNRVVCFDLHSAQIQGFFDIPCDNFYCINMIHKYLVDNHNINKNFDKELDSEFVIIAPDEGALNKVEKAVLIGDKKYLEGRTAIIIDDMADTCGTVIKVGDVLMSKGAKDIIIIVTHGILSGPAIERINNTEYIKEIVVSDTLPQDHNQERCSKLKTFSIAPMLSEVITRLDKGGSLSEIFNN
jgi:ribose-phosphate pyrophosphokinase